MQSTSVNDVCRLLLFPQTHTEIRPWTPLGDFRLPCPPGLQPGVKIPGMPPLFRASAQLGGRQNTLCAPILIGIQQPKQRLKESSRAPSRVVIFRQISYILVGGLTFYRDSNIFFRQLPSELAERNSSKIGHMFGSKCDSKTHVQKSAVSSPLQIRGPKTTTFFRRLRNLTATLTACILGTKHDRQPGKCVGN